MIKAILNKYWKNFCSSSYLHAQLNVTAVIRPKISKKKNRKEHLDVYSTMRWPLNGGDIKWWENKIHP